MSSPSTGSSPEKLSWLAHPITVLLLGTVITALGVPWVTARINDRKLINDAQLQKCIEILKISTETDEQLNGMDTTLEMFIKHSSSTRKSLSEQQERTRIEMEKQYGEFDLHAWWWCSRLPTEAKLLRIRVDDKALGSLIDQYQSNLGESTKTLDELWGRCLQADFSPTDKANFEIAKRVRVHLKALRTTRAGLVGQFVHLIAPSKPPWFS